MLQLYYNIINFFAALEYSNSKPNGGNLRLENAMQQYQTLSCSACKE